jgi:hypothetical protein
MADAYFRVAHRPVVTLISCGPGSCNIPIAVACAFMDSSAFLALTANVPTSQFNRAPFQETYRHFQAEFPAVLRPYVKRSWQPTRVDTLPTALRQAFATMLSGRPGPVNLDVPFNLFKEETAVDLPEPQAWRSGISSRSGGDSEDIRRPPGVGTWQLPPLPHDAAENLVPGRAELAGLATYLAGRSCMPVARSGSEWRRPGTSSCRRTRKRWSWRWEPSPGFRRSPASWRAMP